MKIYIVDFNDSFTWNIFSTLKEIDQNLQVEIVHWLNFEVPLRDKTIVVLGPGPGHPNEYQKFIPKISKILSSSHIYLIGICLGHQLIAKSMGMEIVPSASLVHGQTEQITLPLWDEVFPRELHNKTVEVQRYNSLSVRENLDRTTEVKTLVRKGEIVMMSFKAGISYQFHPESVGTSCPKSFFEMALKFLYNKVDERSNQNHRSI